MSVLRLLQAIIKTVLGVKYNGLPIQAGTRIPASAKITIEVGIGREDEVNESTAIDTVDTEQVDIP